MSSELKDIFVVIIIIVIIIIIITITIIAIIIIIIIIIIIYSLSSLIWNVSDIAADIKYQIELISVISNKRQQKTKPT